MQESVASQLIALLMVSGLNPADITTYPSRRVIGPRDGNGDIEFEIANGECLAVTWIETFHVDMGGNPTMAVSSNPITVGYPARPLETVFEVPTLYVFPPGKAIFTFASIIALPTTTAHIRVSGFILPNEALNRLKLLSLKEVIS